MAVSGTAQIMDRPEGSFRTGEYSIRVKYRVDVTSLNDGPLIVQTASGLPLMFSYYRIGNEFHTDMLLQERDIKPNGSPPTMSWIVEDTYKTLPMKEGREGTRGNASGGGTGRQTPGEFQNPLLELPTVKWHSSGREALITRIYDTITGTFKPVTATNGEVFDPPPKYLQTYSTLEITRNEPIGANQPNIAVAYANAVNSDVFWGGAAGYWRCKEIVPERQDRQIPGGAFKFPFLRVSYSFEYNPDTWDIQLLDYGSYYWDRSMQDPGGVGNPQLQAIRRNITTSDGKPTSAPLNGNGRPLADRMPCTITDGSDTINIPATTPAQQFNVGDTVLFSGVPQVGTTRVRAAAPLTYNTAYYVLSNTVTAGAQAIKVSLTQSGAAITISNPSNQLGYQYMYSPGYFLTLRPYNRLPFRALGLPQFFSQVQ